MTLALWLIVLLLAYSVYLWRTNMANFARLSASVASISVVAASAVALLEGISEQIRAAIEEDDLADDTAIAQLADSLDAETASLSAAVTANTPVEEPAPTPEPTPEPAPADEAGAGTADDETQTQG